MKKILIIEDDPITLSGLAEIFRDEGFSVIGVTNGQLAVGVVLKEPIDIVLCDYKLPDNDGFDVCRKIKQIRPKIKMLLMTAFFKDSMKTRATHIGISQIFLKPLDIDKLLSVLSSLVKKLNSSNGHSNSLSLSTENG